MHHVGDEDSTDACEVGVKGANWKQELVGVEMDFRGLKPSLIGLSLIGQNPCLHAQDI